MLLSATTKAATHKWNDNNNKKKKTVEIVAMHFPDKKTAVAVKSMMKINDLKNNSISNLLFWMNIQITRTIYPNIL